MNDTLLLEVLAELHEVRELVAGRRLSASERARLERALPLVHQITHGALFASADLLAYAQAPTSDATALRAALGALSAKQIGKLFARARGCTIGDYRVRRECDDGGSALWLCLRNKP